MFLCILDKKVNLIVYFCVCLHVSVSESVFIVVCVWGGQRMIMSDGESRGVCLCEGECINVWQHAFRETCGVNDDCVCLCVLYTRMHVWE